MSGKPRRTRRRWSDEFKRRVVAEACNVSKDTATACLKVLIGRGFIRCAKPGAFTYKKRHAGQWELTAWPVEEELPKKDFMRWQPYEKISRS